MRLILMMSLFFWACGEKEEVKYEKIPYQGEEPKLKPSGNIAFGHIQDSCVSCHASQAPVFSSKADMFKNKDAICRVVQAGTMPPSGPLPDPKVQEIKDDLCS